MKNPGIWCVPFDKMIFGTDQVLPLFDQKVLPDSVNGLNRLIRNVEE